MRSVFSWLGVTILVLLASTGFSEEEVEPECFSTEWAMDLIPCFINRFIELLDDNNTVTSSIFQSEVKGPWSHHESSTHRQKSKMYGSFNDMYEFNQAIKYQMMHELGTVRPHSMAEKNRLDAMKKIQKIDFDAVFDHALDQAVASTIVAKQSAEAVLQVAVEAKIIPDFETLDLTEDQLEQVCQLAPYFIPGLGTPLCKVGIRILECLTKYSDTEYEHSLKWAKCLFECEDLPFLSQCVVDHFDGCGLSWPLNDLSWLGSVVVRGFVDYLEMDTCVFQFDESMNITDTIELDEGGPSKTVAFRQYLHPSVHCIDLEMLNSPIGIVSGLLMWIRGQIGECDTKIEISTYNYMNSLLSFRIYLEDHTNLIPLDIDLPVVDLGLPKCRSGAVLRQVVIGWHDHAVNETGVIHLDSSNWNDTFHIPIAAAIDTKKDGDFTGDLTIKLRAGTILRANVKIPLLVRDTDVLSNELGGNTMCSVVNDPHITTFDQFYYSNHHEGHFYVYKHTEMDYSIQGIFQRCERTAQATCLCAVSVRVGNDVFVVDQCRRVNETDPDHKRVQLFVIGDVTPGFQILRKEEGARFEVVLPGGTYARIQTIGRHLNLWIRPAITDLNKTLGLCGTFNRDTTDDLMMPNGTIYTDTGSSERGQPKPFSRSWRVPDDEITYMGMIKSDNVRVHETSSCSCMYVVLAGASCTCSGGHLVETCDIIDDRTDVLTPEIAKITSVSLKQLSQENGFIYYINLDIDEDYDPPVFSWDPNGQYTERTANSACVDEERLNNGGDAMLDKCRKLFGILERDRSRMFEKDRYGCIDDVMISDSLNWTSTFKESAKERCRDYLYARINMATHEVLEDFENVTCLLDCNNRGSCEQGVCECDTPYTGTACEHDGSLTPTFQPLTQLCDVRMENCSYVKVFGKNLFPEQQLHCVFTPLSMAVGGIPTGGSTVHVNASYITSHQVACALPEKSGSYELELVTGTGSEIAVFGNAQTTKMKFLSFDSVCFTCNPTGECSQRESKDHCLIHGHCYAASESSPDEDCSVCIPHQLAGDWSIRPTEECHTKYDEWVDDEEQSMRTRTIRIVIASVLSGTVAVSAIILFVCFGSMNKEQDRLKQEYGMKAREIAKLNAAVMKSMDSGVSVGADINMVEMSAYGYSSSGSDDSPSPSTSVDVKPGEYESFEQDDMNKETVYTDLKL